jgi:hypothetical protein
MATAAKSRAGRQCSPATGDDHLRWAAGMAFWLRRDARAAGVDRSAWLRPSGARERGSAGARERGSAGGGHYAPSPARPSGAAGATNVVNVRLLLLIQQRLHVHDVPGHPLVDRSRPAGRSGQPTGCPRAAGKPRGPRPTSWPAPCCRQDDSGGPVTSLEYLDGAAGAAAESRDSRSQQLKLGDQFRQGVPRGRQSTHAAGASFLVSDMRRWLRAGRRRRR